MFACANVIRFIGIFILIFGTFLCKMLVRVNVIRFIGKGYIT